MINKFKNIIKTIDLFDNKSSCFYYSTTLKTISNNSSRICINTFNNNNNNNNNNALRYYSNTYKDIKDRSDDDDIEPPPKIIVPQDKLNVQFSKSSGAGGQNVNKVNTKAEIRFNLKSAEWIPDYVKTNMRRFYKKNLNNEDEFLITSMKHRFQHLNLKDAMDKLDDILVECQHIPKERIATEFPEYANEKRLKDKSIKKTIKEGRRKQSTSKYFDDR